MICLKTVVHFLCTLFKNFGQLVPYSAALRLAPQSFTVQMPRLSPICGPPEDGTQDPGGDVRLPPGNPETLRT